MIWFVGAGPGAVDLITVRGMELLKQADVVIYAGSLVNPRILDWCRDDCIRYDSAYMTLPEVIDVMGKAEACGQRLVRLHTGDPSLYGAIREQMEELDRRGIAYQVCPGVSSFSGAAAALGAEYTLPGISQSVIITRAEGRTGVPEKERLADLAAHQATMVLFLSMGQVRQVSEQLIEGGFPLDTPAAIVYKATWPEERVLPTTVERLAETAEQNGITKTALIVVGRVLAGVTEKSRLYAPEFATGIRREKRKQGCFYGVGVGAGDPEELTAKAVRVLKSAQVIGMQEGRTAYEIAARACPEILAKETLILHTPMCRDAQALQKAWSEAAGQIAEKLRDGLDVALPVLGDPTVYATVFYLQEQLSAQGFETELVNGIPSFVKAAARAGISLAQGEESLHIFPGVTDMEEAMRLSGTKVFMKLGKQYPLLKERLASTQKQVYVAERAGMDGEQIVRGIAQMPEETGYFTLVIVKDEP